MAKELSMLQGMVLDMVAEGKTPRKISEVTGVPPSDIVRMAYDLLDNEIITDIEQRRKLQVYRLEKLVEALWTRTMENAERDDVRNLREVLSDLNVLLALNKEQDAEAQIRMHSHQFAVYMASLMGLIKAFQLVAHEAPDWAPDKWADWAAEQMEIAKNTMTLQIEEKKN